MRIISLKRLGVIKDDLTTTAPTPKTYTAPVDYQQPKQTSATKPVTSTPAYTAPKGVTTTLAPTTYTPYSPPATYSEPKPTVYTQPAPSPPVTYSPPPGSYDPGGFTDGDYTPGGYTPGGYTPSSNCSQAVNAAYTVFISTFRAILNAVARYGAAQYPNSQAWADLQKAELTFAGQIGTCTGPSLSSYYEQLREALRRRRNGNGSSNGNGNGSGDGDGNGNGNGEDEMCGSVHCPEGYVCCNASCGICVPEGESCIEIACEDEPPVAIDYGPAEEEPSEFTEVVKQWLPYVLLAGVVWAAWGAINKAKT